MIKDKHHCYLKNIYFLKFNTEKKIAVSKRLNKLCFYRSNIKNIKKVIEYNEHCKLIPSNIFRAFWNTKKQKIVTKYLKFSYFQKLIYFPKKKTLAR